MRVQYRGYSKLRTHTAPRKVLYSYVHTYRRVLGLLMSLISSDPCTSHQGEWLPPIIQQNSDF